MSDEYEIQIYATDSGKEPFHVWLKSLKNKKMQASVLLRVQRIRRGNFGDCKSLKDGLYELRIHLGPGLRIYFAKVEDKIVLLLGGGDKSTQSQDIDKAKEYLREFEGVLT